MIALLTFVLVSVVAQAPRTANPPAEEYVHIDGGKNPELIPEWSAWEFAFRTIAGGSKLLPTNVLRQVSAAEADLILQEAVKHVERDRACQQRVERLTPLISRDLARQIEARTREIQLECRWQTLHARDRLLEALKDNPEGQLALLHFVEATKLMTRLTIPKSELSHYRQPQ